MKMRTTCSMLAVMVLAAGAAVGAQDGCEVTSPLPLVADPITHAPKEWTPTWFSAASAHYQPDSTAAPTVPVWTVTGAGNKLVADAPPGGYSVISSTTPFVEGHKLRFRLHVVRAGPSFAIGVCSPVGQPDYPTFAGLWRRESQLELAVLKLGCWINNGSSSKIGDQLDLSVDHTLEVSMHNGSVSVVLDPVGSPTLVSRLGEPALSFSTGVSVQDTSDRSGVLSLFAIDAKVEISSLELTRPSASNHGITLDVTGMHCEMCEASIEGALEKIKGVKKVTSSYKTGMVSVEVDPAAPPSNESLIEAIKALKYGAAVHEPGAPVPAPASPAATK